MEWKGCLISKIIEREKTNKILKAHIVALDYTEKIVLTLSGESSDVSIA